MAATVTHIQVVLPNIDGLAKDEFVNTLTAQTVDDDITGITPVVAKLYNNAYGVNSMAHYISGAASRAANAVEVRYYDVTTHLDGSPVGPPFEVDTFTLAANDGTEAGPNQCCATLSFYDGKDAEGTTRGDHRGRLFLGPLQSSAYAGSAADPNAELNNNFLASAVASIKGFADDLLALDVLFSVWSRKDAMVRTVIGGWVSNSVDVQRRRQWGPTARSTWVI